MKQILPVVLILYVPCLILSTVLFAAGFTIGWLAGFSIGPEPIFYHLIAYAGIFSPIVIFLLGALLFYRRIKSLEISEHKRRLLAILFFLSFPAPLFFLFLLNRFL